AINRGIERATGEVIGLMHSDDVFADDEVLASVAETLARTGADGVYGDLDYVSARDPSRRIRRWRSGGYDARSLRRGWMPPHPTLYLRREVFLRFGTYDTGFRIAADYDAMLRYLVTGEVRLAYIPRVLVRMRLGGASNRSLANLVQKSREDYRAIRRNGVGGAGTLALKNLRKIGQFF
ncbi:MAG: glycosyltransferase, partial [Rhodobacteraceae bacterium]